MDLSLVAERIRDITGAALPSSSPPDIVEVGDRLVWEAFAPRSEGAWRKGWLDVYDALVQDEIIGADDTVDVVVSCRDREAAQAAILCQRAGLPLYTVVLADDEAKKIVRYTQGKAPLPDGWEANATDDWGKTYPDVVAGWADEESKREAVCQAYDDCDYLLHPDTALAWAVTDVYWEEAEHDRVTLILAAKHPFDAACEVWEILSGKRLPQEDAQKALAMDSGWEPPSTGE